MTLNEFVFADSPIRECLTDTHRKSMTILFESGYYIPLEKYMDNVRLTIHDWNDLAVYTSFSTEPRVKIEDDALPVFDAVKLMDLIDGGLVLQGYPVSEGWLVYEFSNPKVAISILDSDE